MSRLELGYNLVNVFVPHLHSHYPSWPAPLSVALTVLDEHECPYLINRTEKLRAFVADAIAPEVYHTFMDAGFRRSGRLVYQPVCRGCRECRPIRVLVNRFRPTRSQRRCVRRNSDVKVTIAPPQPTDEKFDLFRRYMSQWHGSPRESLENFILFLYDSPVHTIEFEYRNFGDKLLAVGICDVCAASLSSVYFYFDPAEAQRNLGTFGAITEIWHAGAQQIPHYYLGYWIAGCGSMSYKASFRPNELLDTDGTWRQCCQETVGSAKNLNQFAH